jgi:hypothetical protein
MASIKQFLFLTFLTCCFAQEFSKRVLEGFQVSPLWHQGFIRDDGR